MLLLSDAAASDIFMEVLDDAAAPARNLEMICVRLLLMLDLSDIWGVALALLTCDEAKVGAKADPIAGRSKRMESFIAGAAN